jgi:predicted transposase/invertase (TIGR01784 family)
MYLARLDNDVIFKKAFSDKLVLTQFIQDILGIKIKIKKIETDKRFRPKIARINFAYDVFAESTDERVIVEIQRVNYDYNFDRFLHYHTMAIAELQRKATDYKIKQTVYTIVVITSPDIFEDRHGNPIEHDELILDFNPRTRDDQIIDFCEHKLIFLYPRFKNKNTPPSYVDWFDLIQESITHPDEPSINLRNKAIKKAATLIEDDNLSPDEREASKIAAATEITLGLYEKKGRKEGQEEGRKEGQQEANLETARKMKAEGFDVKMIVKITGLDIDIVKKL